MHGVEIEDGTGNSRTQIAIAVPSTFRHNTNKFDRNLLERDFEDSISNVVNCEGGIRSQEQ